MNSKYVSKLPAAVPEAKPEPPVTGNRSELTFDLTDPAQCIAASGAVKALHDAGFALPVRDAGYVTPSGAIASLSTPAQPPANPLSPQDDSDAMLILECFGFLRSMDHFYGEEYVPEDSSAQTCITNIRRIINMPPIKAAAPKVVDSKEGQGEDSKYFRDRFVGEWPKDNLDVWACDTCMTCDPKHCRCGPKVEEQDREQEYPRPKRLMESKWPGAMTRYGWTWHDEANAYMDALEARVRSAKSVDSLSSKLKCKWCGVGIHERPAFQRGSMFQWEHVDSGLIRCSRTESNAEPDSLSPSEPIASNETPPCPTCEAPVFIRPNGNIVAHLNGNGGRCSANETRYEPLPLGNESKDVSDLLHSMKVIDRYQRYQECRSDVLTKLMYELVAYREKAWTEGSPSEEGTGWIDPKQIIPTEPDVEYWCHIIPRESYWFNVPGYEHQTKKGTFAPYQDKIKTYKTNDGEIRFNCGANETVEYYRPLPAPPVAPSEPHPRRKAHDRSKIYWMG